MSTIQLTIKVNCGIRYDEESEVYVSMCPRLRVFSQGETESEALEAIRSAVTLHVRTAFDHNRLDKVLRRCGFRKMEGGDSVSQGVSEPDEFIAIRVKEEYKEVAMEIPLTLLAAQSQTAYASAC